MTHFNGPAYSPKHDDARLTGQILRVFSFMKDAQYHTLDEIAVATGDPAASVSAQLRHLRKDRFGAHRIDKQPRGDRKNGLWEYRLIVNKSVSLAREESPLLPHAPLLPIAGIQEALFPL